MKPEQIEKLEQLQGKLLDVAVNDCDPENWKGYGQKPSDMDRETRGNAIYDRKLAGQTLACLVRVGNIIDKRWFICQSFGVCHFKCVTRQ